MNLPKPKKERRLVILCYRGASACLYGQLVHLTAKTLKGVLTQAEQAINASTGILILSVHSYDILEAMIPSANSLGWIVIIPIV